MDLRYTRNAHRQMVDYIIKILNEILTTLHIDKDPIRLVDFEDFLSDPRNKLTMYEITEHVNNIVKLEEFKNREFGKHINRKLLNRPYTEDEEHNYEINCGEWWLV